MSVAYSASPAPSRQLPPVAPSGASLTRWSPPLPPRTVAERVSRPAQPSASTAPVTPPTTPAASATETERELVARLLADEPAAWREFDAKYSRVVLGCIHRILSRFTRVAGSHDVDEIYARFCLQLLANDKRKLRAFDPERGNKLSSWLGLLASHAAYDYLRTLRRDAALEPLPEIERLSSSEASPYELSLLHERARIAAKIMSQLSERDREFVQLYFGEGLEPEEVATEMGISVKTVYSKKHKITARLEGLLLGARRAA